MAKGCSSKWGPNGHMTENLQWCNKTKPNDVKINKINKNNKIIINHTNDLVLSRVLIS